MNQLALELFAPNPETAIRAALDNHDQSCPPNVFKTAASFTRPPARREPPAPVAPVHAWRVVAQQLYPGETFKYPGNPKVRFSYEGTLVKCKGAVCVLAGPELELKP